MKDIKEEIPVEHKYSIVKNLVEYLNDCTKKYDEGCPIISDKEWDEKYFELENLEKETGLILNNSPTQTVQYSVVNKLNKIEHNHKMLSLAKSKDINDIKEFLGENHSYLAMAKMDGLTCTLTYQDGKLISAETRGNGIIGEDVLHNALVLPSIPKQIPEKGKVVIDGEIICTYINFEPFSNLYKNPRNFAAGSIRLLDAKECAKRNLTFVAWEVIEGFNDIKLLHNKLKKLREYAFTVVPYQLMGGVDDPELIIDNLKQISADYSYPIDGLVFKFDDISYGKSLGETAHHFKNAIAYKFYDETYSTKLMDIEWSMGRTGVFTPIAIFEPVEIDGTTVSRASLHNLSVMYEILGPHPHYEEGLEVTKMNMIIPQVISADKSKQERYEQSERRLIWINDLEERTLFHKPKVCPVCGEPLIVIKQTGSDTMNVVCPNPSCEGKLINHLDHFCGKKGLDIKGLSKATFEKLLDWGWINSIADVFTLTEHKNEWINKSGFGEKSVSKILKAIDEARTTTFEKFITAIGIPLVGSNLSKELCKHISSYEDFRQKVDTKFDFQVWEGIGPEISSALTSFNYCEADNIYKNYLKIAPIELTKTEQKKTLENITVVITGSLKCYKNRAELQEVIESYGGKVVSAVSKKTNYLINNDVNSTSSKNTTAKKLGVEIITEQDFIEKFLTL